jgi:hypothetical protein
MNLSSGRLRIEPFLHWPRAAGFQEQLVLMTSGRKVSVQQTRALNAHRVLGCPIASASEWLGSANVMPNGSGICVVSGDDRLRCRRTGFAVVPKSVLEALRATKSIRQHPPPKRFSHNRTHLVWNGDPSPSLDGLMSLLASLAK